MDAVLIGERLREYTQGPMVWGVSDCATVAANIWRDVTGYDPIEDVRGTYKSRWGYMQILHKEGGLRSAARKRMDHPSVIGSDGDGVGVVRHNGRSLFAVRVGGVWVAPDADGGLRNVSDCVVLEAWAWLPQ